MCELDRDAIRQTWQCFMDNKTDNGVEIFCRLFDKHPEYKGLFEKLKDKKRDELKSDGFLRMHGERAADGIDKMVKSLDDKGKFIEIVEKNADDHFARNVKPDYFKNFAGIIIDVVKDASGEKFTPAAQKAWADMLVEKMCGIIEKKCSK